MIVLEIFVLMVREDRWRKRTEPLTVFNPRVEHVLHVGQTRMRNDGSISERARSPFHTALESSDDVAGCNLLCDGFQQRTAFEFAALQTRILQS